MLLELSDSITTAEISGLIRGRAREAKPSMGEKGGASVRKRKLREKLERESRREAVRERSSDRGLISKSRAAIPVDRFAKRRRSSQRPSGRII